MFEEQDIYTTYKKPTQTKVYKGRRHGGTVKADPHRLHTDSTRHHQCMSICPAEREVDSVQIGSETFKTSRNRRTVDQGVKYSLNKNKRWELVGDRKATKEEERRKKREVLDEDKNLPDAEYATDTPKPRLAHFHDEVSGITAAISSQTERAAFEVSRYNRHLDNNAFGTPYAGRTAEETARYEAEDAYMELLSNAPARDKLKRAPITKDSKGGTRVIHTRKGPTVIHTKKEKEIEETTPKPAVDFAISVYGSPGRWRMSEDYGYNAPTPRCHKHRYNYGE